jgi:hypothetical protein
VPLQLTATGVGQGDYCGPESVTTCVANTLIHIGAIDLDFGAVSDNDEEDPGGFLGVNDDDDDETGLPDFLDFGPTAGEDDLLPLTLTVDGGHVGTLTLSAVAGGNRIELYEDPSRESPVSLPQSWRLYGSEKTLHVTFFVEAVSTSSYLRDIQLLLELEHDSGARCEDRVFLTAYRVVPDRIDASDPELTRAYYRVEPLFLTVDTARFHTPQSTDIQFDVNNDFYFIYSQHDVYEHMFVLEAEKSGAIYRSEFELARHLTEAPGVGLASELAVFRVAYDNASFNVVVRHEIRTKFRYLCYSVPVVEGSKTIWIGEPLVNIITSPAEGIPTAITSWVENCRVASNLGQHFELPMIPETQPTTPPQGPHFRSARLSIDRYFQPDTSLTVFGSIEYLMFSATEGPVLAIPLLNTEIDLPLEENAAPPVFSECP